jgi:uncharacterized integral membrane protein
MAVNGVALFSRKRGGEEMQKGQVLFIIGLVFAILITVFALSNSKPVAISLLFYEVNASQALIIFVSAALGAIIVAALGMVRYIRRMTEIRRLRKEIESLKKEIAFLESLTEETPVNEKTESAEFNESVF